MTYLDISENLLKGKNGYWTAKEICQQPEMWKKTKEILDEKAPAIKKFLEPLIKTANLRIILTGAGSSSYIGECLAPFLLNETNKNVTAIATTDLVSGPQLYFQKDVPTLLVSFSRSGSSPESMAAVELSKQMVKNCYQLIITCNEEGELYKMGKGDKNSLSVVMPEETNDKSLAMTSSFSAMIYAGLNIFSNNFPGPDRVAGTAASLIEEKNNMLKNLAQKSLWRVVFLGSNELKGLAREASLKLLELTDGKIFSTYESPLGFRHGPKSVINGNTLVMMFISNDPYTRQYDLDLLNEIRKDRIAGRVIAISACADDELGSSNNHIKLEGMEGAGDAELLFPYLVIAQIYAFHRSLALGNEPDSPSNTGTINRVVEGVNIYNYD